MLYDIRSSSMLSQPRLVVIYLSFCSAYQYVVPKFCNYKGADKSLARPWKGISYSDQDLWRTNDRNILLLFVRHKSWCSIVSLGRCSLLPSRVGLRNYQHPGNY